LLDFSYLFLFTFCLTMSAGSQLFALAWKHHQTGGLAQAEQLYRQVLHSDPNHADAWCFLGAACQAQGKLAEAEMSYRRALQIAGNYGNAHNCLGVLLAQQNRFAEAGASFEQAVRHEPGNAEAHYNWGLALSAQGQRDAAIEQFRQAVHYKPDYPEALNDLGNALAEQDTLGEAVTSYQQALRLRPRYATVHYNLGDALRKLGRLDEAIAHWRDALQIQPDFPQARDNFAHALVVKGLSLQERGKLNEAEHCFREALQINPDFAEAHNDLGTVFEQRNDLEPAIRCYQEALRIKPAFAEAHNNVGCVYLRLGRLDMALRSIRQALRIQPDLVTAQSNLVSCLHYDADAEPDAVFAEHCRWGQLVEQAAVPCPHSNDPSPDRRLRIGYVSANLCFHPLARYLEPVLANHDPKQVEIHCYAEVRSPDAVTARLRTLVHGWRSTCGLKDSEVAECIRQDQIDILVDLAGHTAQSRLSVFAHKPAPIQATWLGYMNTTGLTTVDYRLTDDVLDPLSDVRCLMSGVKNSSSDIGHRTSDIARPWQRDTEELMRLPSGMCCFAPPSDAPPVSPSPALERGHLTFGSLNSLLKFNEKVFDLWSRVLKALPTSRLLMFHHKLKGPAREAIRGQLVNLGVEPERLDLRQGSSASGYLGVYGEIDISLDTFPCTGGVTTCESLWMGVPVLSLCGVRPAGRNSAALLARVGLGEWAVNTPEEYVALAVNWANNLNLLGELREQLRERMAATVCDARRFTRELENAYHVMWRKWCELKRTPLGKPHVGNMGSPH
jgi:protein O-GlcNAc transferase